MHRGARQKESRSDLISVSCGTSCTATWLWANLSWVFGTGWFGRLGRWRYGKPLSTSLPSQGPVFLTTSEGIYCCAVFSHCPSTAVSASSIFIYVYLKHQHALLLLLLGFFPAEVVLCICNCRSHSSFASVCTGAFKFHSSALSVTHLICSCLQQGSSLSWRMYEGRGMITPTSRNTNCNTAVLDEWPMYGNTTRLKIDTASLPASFASSVFLDRCKYSNTE